MAVIWSVLFTFFAALVSTGLVWQSLVVVKRAETLRDRGQAVWIAKAGVAYARWILFEDERGVDPRTSVLFDHLGEPWAQRIEKVALTEFLPPKALPENTPTWAENARFSGGVEDLHGRLNLENLFPAGAIKREDALPLANLMRFLGFDEPSFQRLLDNLNRSVDKDPLPTEGLKSPRDAAHELRRSQWLSEAITGLPVSDERKTALSAHLVWLPERTRVNVNTAPLAVLAAAVGSETPETLNPIEVVRNRIPIRSLAELQGVIPSHYHSSLNTLTVSSRYFLAAGSIELGHTSLFFESLLRRDNGVVSAISFQTF